MQCSFVLIQINNNRTDFRDVTHAGCLPVTLTVFLHVAQLLSVSRMLFLMMTHHSYMNMLTASLAPLLQL